MTLRDRWAGIPKLIRFIAVNAGLGVLVGWGVGAALLYIDAGGIGTLFQRSDIKIVAGFLYFGSFAITFATCMVGTAIMLLPGIDDS